MSRRLACRHDVVGCDRRHAPRCGAAPHKDSMWILHGRYLRGAL